MTSGLLRSTRALIEQLPAFGGGREGIALPFQFIFSGEDGLRLFVSNVVNGLTLRLCARWLPSGDDTVQALTYDFTPTSNGSDNFFHISLDRGVLLNVVVLSTNATVQRGQTYVRIDIERGANARVTLGTLLAGYIDSSGGRAWPGSPLEGGTEGRGWIHTVVFPAGNPGFAIQAQAALSTRWRVITARTIFTTGAAVANRRPVVQAGQNGGLILEVPASRVQVAGEVIQHTWAAGVHAPEGTGVATGVGGLPVDMHLQSDNTGNSAVTISSYGIQAADVFSVSTLLVEEWRAPVTIEPS
jgi:hypothetical protein